MTLPSKMPRPVISVIIIAYNMAREIPRTVQSFLPPYQRAVTFEDVEIIVMENGSSAPLDPEVVRGWPNCVRYVQVLWGSRRTKPSSLKISSFVSAIRADSQ